MDLVNCTVTAPVTHFSKYILIDKTQFDKVFEVEIKGPTEIENLNKPLDVVLVIDSSGSMDWNDPQNIRLDVAKDFVDKLSDKDKVGIVDFDSYAYSVCKLTANKDEAKTAIESIDSWGGTSLTAGIKKAFEQFGISTLSTFSLEATQSIEKQSTLEENQTNGLSNLGIQRQKFATQEELEISPISNKISEPREALKYIIMLTDGEGDYNSNLTAQAIQNNIIIYTIGLGSSIDEALLASIATQTGGKYYNAAVADDLIKEFDRITQDVVNVTKDSDGDGLSDYHEERLRWFNGITIQTDPNNPDTDGDGVLDGEEVSVVVDDKNNVHHYTMHSNPMLADTDGDGLLDAKSSLSNIQYSISLSKDNDGDFISDANDPEPLVYNITDRTLGLTAGIAYTDLERYKNKTISQIFETVNWDGIGGLSEVMNFRIIAAGDSGTGKVGDDAGLGYVAIQIARDSNKSLRKNVIVLAFRGSEFDDDKLNDLFSNGKGILLDTYVSQANNAYNIYKRLVKEYPNNDFYLTGHSMGGRITQDVLMKIYDNNHKNWFSTDIKEPYKSATFNGYGYLADNYQGSSGKVTYEMMEYYKSGRLYNYTMKGDIVGNYLGPKKLGYNKEPFIAHDMNGTIIDISNEKTPWGKGTSLATVHGITLFHINKDFYYKGSNSKINIYEVQFIGPAN